MAITVDTADQLDALAVQIQVMTAADPAVDAQLAELIREPMQAINGRALATARYTLNITNALQLRAKKWYMSLDEYNIANAGTSSKAPCQCGLLLTPDSPAGQSWSVTAPGNSIGLATCAAICRCWATIIRLWLANNYQA